MFHSHILEHEDRGMIGEFVLVEASGGSGSTALSAPAGSSVIPAAASASARCGHSSMRVIRPSRRVKTLEDLAFEWLARDLGQPRDAGVESRGRAIEVRAAVAPRKSIRTVSRFY
jgi:hypothetical protein